MSHLMKGLAVALVATVLLIPTGCQKQVEVEVGTKVVCTHGEVISDDTRVVKVPAQDAANYSVQTVTRTCDRHLKLEALYSEAQKAIEKGDFKAAQAKLAQVVALDPAFAQAQTQLETIKGGKKPAVDKSGGQAEVPTTPAKPKPGEGDTSVPSGSLLRWAPDQLDGYKAAKPSIDPLNIAREYVPSGASPVTFVIVAEQGISPTAAKRALSVQVQRSHPNDADSVKVNGHTAYFGTDGRRFAVLGFTDGAVMVALEMSGKAGSDPKDLKDELVEAAKQLP